MNPRIISLILIFCMLLALLPIQASAYDTADLTIPPSAEAIVYGQSGAGRDLMAYRFGTGENVMVIGFAIHGYEDIFAKDGGALVYTAGLLMELLEDHMDTVTDYGWSIYVLPCMNPDGLIDGTTENGPGRCTTTYLDAEGNLIADSGKGIDMNRSFPYGWVQKTDARNFNGDAPLSCPESQALASFIEDVKGDGTNICLDVHGWLSQIITSNGSSSQLYQIFKSAFPNNTYANCMNGAGYFTAYAGSIGYTACLFEFPAVYSLSAFQSSGYPEKFNQCILALAEAYGTYQAPTPEPEINHEDTCPSAGFSDLDTSAWYHEATDFVLDAGLFLGTSASTFEPDTPLTRSMLATLLYRMSGEGCAAESVFPDVSLHAWYAESVTWAQQEGIFTGFPDGTFRPDEEITREQLVTVLYRYAQRNGTVTEDADDLSGYMDAATVGAYAREAMAWACGNDIIHGVSMVNGTALFPLKGATRAEVAQVFLNYHTGIQNTVSGSSAEGSETADTALFSHSERFTPTDGPDLSGN